MLKLSLMYKVWNGLALRHLKVRLTSDQWWNSEFRVLGLSPEFWVCWVCSPKLFNISALSIPGWALPPHCKINTTTLKQGHSTDNPFQHSPTCTSISGTTSLTDKFVVQASPIIHHATRWQGWSAEQYDQYIISYRSVDLLKIDHQTSHDGWSCACPSPLHKW